MSHGSIHRWLWQLGAAFRKQVEASRRRLFGAGQVARTAARKVAALFCEADGVVLRLQRESKKVIEAKLAIVHAGWERRLLEQARNAVAAALDPEAKRGAEELLSYLLANREGLQDYRRRVEVEGADLRGLGDRDVR